MVNFLSEIKGMQCHAFPLQTNNILAVLDGAKILLFSVMNFFVVAVGKYSDGIHKRVPFLCQKFNLCTSCALQAFNFAEEAMGHDSYYTELQRGMWGYATSGCIREAFQTLNLVSNVSGKPSVYDYNALIYHGLKSKHVLLEELVEIFIMMKRFGPHPNASTFNTILNGMLSHGKLKDAFVVAEEMCICGFLPSFRFLSKLLRKCLESGYSVNAFSVFKFMLKLDYLPAEPTLNLLIVCLSKAGMISEAYLAFSVLLEQGLFQGAHNYNSILWALCKSGQSYTALTLFYCLKKKGVTHNECSYTALIYGFSRERLWEEACRCFSEMQTGTCKPNVITYTTYIKFLCDDGKIEEALGLLNKMDKEGCDPDILTYNIILRKLSQETRIDEIGELFQAIDEKGLCPDPFTYAALAGGLLKGGNLRLATSVLCAIFSRRCAVDVAIYNICFNILCHENRLRVSLNLLKSMIEIGFVPNNVSYNTILKGFCNKDIDEALTFFDSIEWGANGPDPVSFNTILSAACKQGDSPMIRRILYRMEYEGVKLNAVSSTCLIQYFCIVGKISEGVKLLEAMMLSGPIPTVVTLNLLVSGLCKNRLLGIAYQISKYLETTGLLPDMITYNILINASIREGNDELVIKLLREMHSRRLNPDVVTFGSIIYGLCNKGEIAAALQLQDQMVESGTTPSIAIYNTILEAMIKRGKFWDIILLLKEMLIQGCEPNADSFKILQRSISKGRMKEFPGIAKFLEFVLSVNSVKETHHGFIPS